MTTETGIRTSRFGQIAVEAEDTIVFTEGLVGLPDLKNFVLVHHKDDSPFRWLQSLDDGSVAFLVVDPASYVPGYTPEMPESAAAALEIRDETPILVYTICSIPNGDPKGMTLNLAGPVVINAEKRKARQVVLEDEEYQVRYQVFSSEPAEAA